MTNYEKQAKDFCEKTGTEINSIYLGHYPRFNQYIVANFRVTIKRGSKSYSFDFSSSINDSWEYIKNLTAFKATWVKGLPNKIDLDKFFQSCSKGVEFADIRKTHTQPTVYIILACVQKYDVGTFSDFCAEFGYNEDSRKALDIYLSVQEEYKNIHAIFSDVMEELEEIN